MVSFKEQGFQDRLARLSKRKLKPKEIRRVRESFRLNRKEWSKFLQVKEKEVWDWEMRKKYPPFHIDLFVRNCYVVQNESIVKARIKWVIELFRSARKICVNVPLEQVYEIFENSALEFLDSKGSVVLESVYGV